MSPINFKVNLALLLLLAAFTFLVDAATSLGINSEVAYASHNLRYLPGTPSLKNGYELTSEGIRPIIENNVPRLIAVN